jgi:hypothetical protein
VERQTVVAVVGSVGSTSNLVMLFLGYNQSEFNRLASSEEIPPHKRGAGYRYNREEHSEWLLWA